MVSSDTNSQDLIEFYINKSPEGHPSIFHVWEDGGSVGDSVTPSTYSAEYRHWMVDMIVAELDRNGGGLLSLGCGNAAVEAEVIRRGHDVVAIDAMEVAVQMARLKNVDAVCADIYQWDPQRTWAVAYINGVLGHLFDSMVGLVPVLSRIRTWLAPNADRRLASRPLSRLTTLPRTAPMFNRRQG